MLPSRSREPPGTPIWAPFGPWGASCAPIRPQVRQFGLLFGTSGPLGMLQNYGQNAAKTPSTYCKHAAKMLATSGQHGQKMRSNCSNITAKCCKMTINIFGEGAGGNVGPGVLQIPHHLPLRSSSSTRAWARRHGNGGPQKHRPAPAVRYRGTLQLCCWTSDQERTNRRSWRKIKCLTGLLTGVLQSESEWT